MAIKINGDPQINSLLGPKKVKHAQAGRKMDGSQPVDRVDLSSQVSQSSTAQRAAKVQELKEQVENGTYQPDMHQVATSLLAYLSKSK